MLESSLESTEARIAQVEIERLQEHEHLQQRAEAADAARLQADKTTKNCEVRLIWLAAGLFNDLQLHSHFSSTRPIYN